MWRLILGAVVVVTMTACLPGGDNGALPPEPTVPPEAQTFVDSARADLAQSANVPSDQIRVRRVTAQQFPDTSLGCPQPGMMYQQVITPGWVIELMVRNDVVTYHAGRNRVVRCDRP